MTTSIIQPWVEKIGLRHQGVLVAAVRGCDGKRKNDASKALNRAVRHYVLVPFDAREYGIEDGFMSYDHKNLASDVKEFRSDMDSYPLHYVTHMAHAFEVIGYYHPDYNVAAAFISAYSSMVRALHLSIETKDVMDERLNEDRIVLLHTDEHEFRGCFNPKVETKPQAASI